MKKIILFILTLFLLVGCNEKKEYDAFGQEVTPDPVSDSEKMVMMINDCIKAYNENKINDLELQYSTTLPDLPLELTTLPELVSYNELEDSEIIGTNADFIKIYHIDDKYSIQFQLYEPLNSIWLDSKYTFLVNPDHIIKNDPTFAKEKNILDEILTKQEIVINLLYGSGITLSNPHPSKENYYEVVEYQSIDEIKSLAEDVFTQEYLVNLYEIAFEQENAIYLEENSKLYASETTSSINARIPYNTSYIVATSYEDNKLLVDITAGYGDDILPQIYRIILIDEGKGYRLNNNY
ncbi:MAG: hypothetical protein MR210_00670 [Erysipelotrichaceae bacterium]|nr:hypothetical protein [Erysipelotrichaceae bacterium]MDY5252563.1 hypothetical protein [Erysipelotrichaceae bacterium]